MVLPVVLLLLMQLACRKRNYKLRMRILLLLLLLLLVMLLLLLLLLLLVMLLSRKHPGGCMACLTHPRCSRGEYNTRIGASPPFSVSSILHSRSRRASITMGPIDRSSRSMLR